MLDASAEHVYSSFDHWHHVTCRTYSLTECRHASSGSFRGSVEEHSLGALSVSDVSSFSADYPLEITRGPSEIRRDPRDDLMLYLVCQGVIGISQDGRASHANVGDFFVYDQSRPFRLLLGTHARGIVLGLPRAQALSRLAASRQFTARRVDGATRLGNLTRSIIGQLTAFRDDGNSLAAGRIGASVIDIVATTLQAQLGGDPSVEDRRLQRVKRYMLKNLGNADLSVETIALHNNVAERTLYRLFLLENTTPIRWLWQQRLTSSYEALVEGRARSITDAALDHGFVDISHFSRSFKKRFGCSPRTLVRRP